MIRGIWSAAPEWSRRASVRTPARGLLRAGIGDEITRFQTGIRVEACQAGSAVLIERETRAHVVREIQRGRTGAGIGHVRHVLLAGTFAQPAA